jgi:hypothetical protein
VCNRVDTGTEPELPEDFVVDIRKIRGRWDYSGASPIIGGGGS